MEWSPEKPFFRGTKKKHCASADSVHSSLSRSAGENSGLLPIGISPGKRYSCDHRACNS